jgi:hypothetical protein
MAGPLESLIYAGRRFSIDGEADAAIALPGKMNEMKPNGDGTYRVVQSQRVGRANTIPIVIDPARGDVEFLQELQNSPNPDDFVLTESDGTVYNGNGKIAEDPERSTKENVMEISIHGHIERQGA